MALKRSDKRGADKEDIVPLHDEEDEEEEEDDEEDTVNTLLYLTFYLDFNIFTPHIISHTETYKEKVQSFHR